MYRNPNQTFESLDSCKISALYKSLNFKNLFTKINGNKISLLHKNITVNMQQLDLKVIMAVKSCLCILY